MDGREPIGILPESTVERLKQRSSQVMSGRKGNGPDFEYDESHVLLALRFITVTLAGASTLKYLTLSKVLISGVPSP